MNADVWGIAEACTETHFALWDDWIYALNVCLLHLQISHLRPGIIQRGYNERWKWSWCAAYFSHLWVAWQFPFIVFPALCRKKNTALRVDLCQGSEVLAISLEAVKNLSDPLEKKKEKKINYECCCRARGVNISSYILYWLIWNWNEFSNIQSSKETTGIKVAAFMVLIYLPLWLWGNHSLTE